MKVMRISLFFALALTVCAAGAGAQTQGYVAGLHPDRRPDAAPPPPSEVMRTPEQVESALHGVEKPVPGNVESIAATGNWWVPLRRPGMAAPYDLRGWHGAPPPPAKPASGT
jgi:hypothetical protein